MNRRQKIIVSVTGIFIVLLILVGLTYAYFLTKITGNTNNKSISVTTANLALEYSDGTDIVLTSEDKLIPGEFSKSKTFTVENTGNATVEDYAVVIENVVNPLDRPEDMEMTLTCKSNVTGKTCDGTSGSLPNQNDVLVTNSIDEDEIQTYTLTLTYVDPGVDQSSDMNKTIEGKLNIIDTHNTLDISGTVATVSEGDYVQINSVPRKSQIINKIFKVVGVEPGTHTIGVYSSNGTLKGSSTFTLTKATNESVSGTTINFTDESGLAIINIGSNYSISIDEELKMNIPYKEGTIAYKLMENDKIVKNTTVPNFNNSATTEEGLYKAEDDYGETWYFRGAQSNNYVKFAGLNWRIVRINGDGTVRLILDQIIGEKLNLNSDTYQISDLKFNNYSNDNAYVGYMYGTPGSNNYDATHKNLNDSQIKTQVDAFYENNLLTYKDYIADTMFCGDKSLSSKSKSAGYGETQTYYAGYERLYTSSPWTKAMSPTLKCAEGETNTYSRYTVDSYETPKGVETNGDLKYPIALLTADEVVMSGEMGFSSKSYLHSKNLVAYYEDREGSGDEDLTWWTMTPSKYGYFNFDSPKDEYCKENPRYCPKNSFVFDMFGWNWFKNSLVYQTSFKTLRPVINLKSDLVVKSGDGTETSPYEVKFAS